LYKTVVQFPQSSSEASDDNDTIDTSSNGEDCETTEQGVQTEVVGWSGRDLPARGTMTEGIQMEDKSVNTTTVNPPVTIPSTGSGSVVRGRGGITITTAAAEPVLGGVNQTNSNLTGVNHANSTLTGVNQANSNLTGVNQANSNLTGVNQANSNLTGVNQANSTLTGVNQANSTLTGVNQANSTLTGVNQANSNLTGVNQANSNLAVQKSPSAIMTTRINETPTTKHSSFSVFDTRATDAHLIPDARRVRGNVGSQSISGTSTVAQGVQDGSQTKSGTATVVQGLRDGLQTKSCSTTVAQGVQDGSQTKSGTATVGQGVQDGSQTKSGIATNIQCEPKTTTGVATAIRDDSASKSASGLVGNVKKTGNVMDFMTGHVAGHVTLEERRRRRREQAESATETS